jgi:FMN phosphatase YigB (HAD superfamily)
MKAAHVIHPVSALRGRNDVSGIVIGFDLDNTLLDADGQVYGRTVRSFLASGPSPLDVEAAFADYETLRSTGDVLERLGLSNPIHDRGNANTLAAFCLLCASAEPAARTLGLPKQSAGLNLPRLIELVELDRSSRTGPWNIRLRAERTLLTALLEERASRFVRMVRELALDPRIREWARRYRRIERQESMDEAQSIISDLSGRGAECLVITEGRRRTQEEKLRQTGLDGFPSERLLITETAAGVAGAGHFSDALHQMLRTLPPTGTWNSEELRLHWFYECIRREWLRKTPSFYARCLHAMQTSIDRAGSALSELAVVSASDWKPLRFIMIGDRYDTDTRPVIELLGNQAAFTVRLQSGKYAHQPGPETTAAHVRPSRTFGTSADLKQFLATELSASMIPFVSAPPSIIPPAEIRSDYLRRGLNSPFQFVRSVARAVLVAMV